LIDAVSIPVLVSGGVSSKADVCAVKELGAGGCILGSALYSGKISLKEALEANNENC
jgi:phosphoribosylformimino-5-aminoimidazole carboxamide ribotide isomerase